jgi:UDPglucose 6-dehydrogenase
VQVVSNPEFLREGSAVADCLNPDRIVVGGESPEAFRMMRRPLRPAHQARRKLHDHELGVGRAHQVCGQLDACRAHLVHERDDDPLRALRRRHRRHSQGDRVGQPIGPAFLRAGAGYGGSCFPKDVAAMEHISRAAGHESLFVNAIQTINKNQKKRFVDKIEQKLWPARIEGSKIAVWGWRSRPTPTTSARAPRWTSIRHLLDKGAQVRCDRS